MTIRQMSSDDLDFAFFLTRSEGWLTETRASFETFLFYDPSGAFVAEEGGERIGMCVGVAYQEFGFLGELIVLPEFRGKGYGSALFNHTLGFFKKRGVATVVLHGDVPAVPIYEQAGFRKICRSVNFLGSAQTLPYSDSIRPMTQADLEEVHSLDRTIFGADRSVFLQRFFQLAPQHCFVEAAEDGALVGFITGRIGNGVVAAGPWIVHRKSKAPGDLLKAIVSSVVPGTVRIDLLESQSRGLALLAEACPFLKETGHSWKMMKGPDLKGGHTDQALAVGTPATG